MPTMLNVHEAKANFSGCDIAPGSMTASATTPVNQNDANVNTILLDISRPIAKFHDGCGIWRL